MYIKRTKADQRIFFHVAAADDDDHHLFASLSGVLAAQVFLGKV